MGTYVTAAPLTVHASDGLDTVTAHRLTVTGLQSGRVMVTGNANVVATSNITASQLGFLQGLTDNIQTQLNDAKLQNMTPNRVIITNPAGNATTSVITAAQLGYLGDVTGNIQAQLNGKQATITTASIVTAATVVADSFGLSSTSDVLLYRNGNEVTFVISPTLTGNAYVFGLNSGPAVVFNTIGSYFTYPVVGNYLSANNRVLIADGSKVIRSSNVTIDQLDCLVGATSNIQQQLLVLDSTKHPTITSATALRVGSLGISSDATYSIVTASSTVPAIGTAMRFNASGGGGYEFWTGASRRMWISNSAASFDGTVTLQGGAVVTGDLNVTGSVDGLRFRMGNDVSGNVFIQRDTNTLTFQGTSDGFDFKWLAVTRMSLNAASGLTVALPMTITVSGTTRFAVTSSGADITGALTVSGSVSVGASAYLQPFGTDLRTVVPADGSATFWFGGSQRCSITADGVTLPSKTASRVLVTDANKVIQSSAVTADQLAQLVGVSTAQTIQAQLDGKQPTVNSGSSLVVGRLAVVEDQLYLARVPGSVLQLVANVQSTSRIDLTVGDGASAAATKIRINNSSTQFFQDIQFTTGSSPAASCVLVTDASRFIKSSTVTATELGYLDGVTSSVQNQLDGKQATITGSTALVVGSLYFANASTNHCRIDPFNTALNYSNTNGSGNHNFLIGPTSRLQFDATNFNIKTNTGMSVVTATTLGSSNLVELYANVAAAANYIRCYFGVVNKFRVSGTGAVYGTGAYNASGADYAEYFEWEDGNPAGEDRRGVSVVLGSDGTIVPATGTTDPDDIIGVVTASPSVVGDAAWSHWSNMHLKDEFGAVLTAPQEMWEIQGQLYTPGEVPEDVDASVKKVVTVQVPVVNPDYDSSLEYVPRSDRPEWSAVGLMGKLRVRVGQPVGTRWKLLRHISPTVDEYLVV